MRLNGNAHSQGVQLDEAALPVLLLNLIHQQGVLDDRRIETYCPMVRRAAAGELFRRTADLWNDLIEPWTYVTDTPPGTTRRSGGVLLPEQVWDCQDIPERGLYRGRPSGSAMPLAWAHAEYLRLLRSIRDGRIFDQPADTWQRYVENKTRSDLCLRRFDHQSDSIFAGRKLRVELMAPAVVHYSTDDWHTAQDIGTRDTALGFHFVDLPVQQLRRGGTLHFTFRWPEAHNRWEGTDFHLDVEPPLESEFKGRAARASRDNRSSPESDATPPRLL